jgi:hypothetical protein
MSLGFDREVDLINLGDTAEVRAYLYDEEDAPEDQADLASVEFTIQKPDSTRSTVAGTVGIGGEGVLRYDETDLTGQYMTMATFTLANGDKKSVRADFEVIDPFNPPTPSSTEVVGTYVWQKIEDCFDAEDEGPWLRDMTLNYFNERKMKEFIGMALFTMNERHPPTKLTIDYFFKGPGDPTVDLPFLAQAVFIEVIKHLMRSYVEQPDIQGAQVVYENRRDYLQRWQLIYQMEVESYNTNLAYFKRRFMGIGHTKMIVDSKAGRLLPAPMRVRTTGRGYW